MIFIQNRQRLRPHLGRSLRRRLHRLLDALELADAEVSLLLCDDETIQELNCQWRDVDAPTDVLSFPLEDPTEVELPSPPEGVFPLRMLGDIVISVETCLRQASAWQHTPLQEATRLVVHGLLHLCGYDHHTPQQAQQMLAEEERLLALFPREQTKPLVSS